MRQPRDLLPETGGLPRRALCLDEHDGPETGTVVEHGHGASVFEGATTLAPANGKTR